MALQTPNLIMVGLGVLGDVPSSPLQPALVDGAHLRWAFKREAAFPWHGFYLYRRFHRPGPANCLGDSIGAMPAGPLLGNTLPVPNLGALTSDQNLVLTEDFGPAGTIEVDLAERDRLDFLFPTGEPAFAVQVTVGFRDNAEITVSALSDGHLAVQQTLAGSSGDEQTVMLRFDKITAIAFSAGSAALIDLCAWPVLRDALGGWEPIPEFQYPLCLPVNHPEYPCSGGAAENLADMRSLAESRIRYGDPGRFLSPLPVLDDQGQVSVTQDSALVTGSGTGWSPKLNGAVLQVDGQETAYTIIAVLAPDRLVLSRNYGGPSLVNAAYTIRPDPFAQLHDSLAQLVQGGPVGPDMGDRFVPQPVHDVGTVDPVQGAAIISGSATSWTADLEGLLLQVDDENAAYRILSVDSPTQLRLDRPYASTGGTGKPYVIRASLTAFDPDELAPSISQQFPLDLVLLGSLEPAIAQMVGLYWVDEQVPTGEPHDYLIVADHTGLGENDPRVLLDTLKSVGFADVDAYIVFNKRKAPSPALSPPAGQTVYALPGSGMPGLDSLGSNSAGLVWDLPVDDLGQLLPGQPIMYHIWRSDLGENEPASTPPAEEFTPITVADEPAGLPALQREPLPVIVAKPLGKDVKRPPSWPDFQLYFLDNGLADGWYSYRLTGIDLFGRHSPHSAPANWRQWEDPEPDPLPWYYESPPSNQQIHPFAVRLLDKLPPPAPTAVEAYALDPDDPWVLQDAAYTAWRATLSPGERDTVIGLRVSWLWTADHMRQAPDTREFRLYYNDGSALPTPDRAEPVNWDERLYVVPFDEHVEEITDGAGRPLRRYELFLPAPGDADRDGLALDPTRADPVVYAHVGVSAVDDKEHTADNPHWDGTPFGGRPGNEGPVSPPAKVFRVLREPPPPPQPPPADSDRVFATPADYHGHSFYTFRWMPLPDLMVHVFRALDDAVFQADWGLRPRPALSAAQSQFFPDEALEPRWNAVKRQQVADELNQLNDFDRDAEGRQQAMAFYKTLSNDGLRVLAGLPGVERAFKQLTIQPLDPTAAANANRRGRDNPDDFVVDPDQRAYEDTLDGRTSNRYFYRAAYVDGAHNLGSLGLSGPPIYLPDVVPPRAPVITRILGGDREITLRWASNREPDLAEYRIFRAESQEAARDLRLMTLVHTEPVPPGAPSARPAEVEWLDNPVPGLTDFCYRLVAIDQAGNNSAPSSPVIGRAFDDSRPDPPTWNPVDSGSAPNAVLLSWSSPIGDLRCLVQRRSDDVSSWENLSGWLARGLYFFEDTNRETGEVYHYRLRVLDNDGKMNREHRELTV